MICIGSVETTDLDLEIEAFETPKPGRTRIAYDRVRALPEYGGYLVRITKKSEEDNTISFYALSPGDTSKASIEYDLDLTDFDSVWPSLPSTLTGWDEKTKNCALLFLTDGYVADKKDLSDARPQTFGPCTKHPCVGGDLQATKREISRLQGENTELLTSNTRLLDEHAKLQRINAALELVHADLSAEHARITISYTALKQQVIALKPMLSQEQLAKIDSSLFA